MTEYTRINRKYEEKWFPKIKKTIDGKVDSVVAAIDRGGLEAGLAYLNKDLTNPALTAEVNKLYEEVGLRHARKNEIRLTQVVRNGKKSSYGPDEIKRLGNSETWVQFIQEYLQRYLIEKITFKVNDTTKNELLKIINEGIANGDGITKIVSALETTGFTAMQSARIVRTEVNRAANVGVLAQGISFEYELQKGWISVHDNRTRGINPEDHADHINMDGLWVDFNDVFRDPRNGVQLEHPGDPNAPAGDTVNCRCNMTTRPKRDERGRMIPKRSGVVVVRNFNRTNRIITI